MTMTRRPPTYITVDIVVRPPGIINFASENFSALAEREKRTRKNQEIVMIDRIHRNMLIRSERNWQKLTVQCSIVLLTDPPE
jgi:hypothetical protein